MIYLLGMYSITVGGEEYRAYFDPLLLKTATGDSLLAKYVTTDIIKESSDYVEALAYSYGVNVSQIAIPTPYKVSKIALFYAYILTALYKAQMSVGKDANLDSFALKYKYYKDLLDQFEAGITADTFTDGKQARKRKFPMTVPLARN